MTIYCRQVNGTLAERFRNNVWGLRFLELNERENLILDNANYFKLWSKKCSYKFKSLYDLASFCMNLLNKKNNTKFVVYAVANSLPNQSTPTDACIGSFN